MLTSIIYSPLSIVIANSPAELLIVPVVREESWVSVRVIKQYSMLFPSVERTMPSTFIGSAFTLKEIANNMIVNNNGRKEYSFITIGIKRLCFKLFGFEECDDIGIKTFIA